MTTVLIFDLLSLSHSVTLLAVSASALSPLRSHFTWMFNGITKAFWVVARMFYVVTRAFLVVEMVFQVVVRVFCVVTYWTRRAQPKLCIGAFSLHGSVRFGTAHFWGVFYYVQNLVLF